MSKKHFQAFTQMLEYIIKYFKLVVVFAAVIIVISGIYRVESNEAAVVLRFGRLVGNTIEEQVRRPGLHFALPFFIDEVIIIPVQTIHERDITTHFIEGRERISPDVEMNGYLLTGDNNIVLIRARVMYQIENPVQYAILNKDTGLVIDGVLSAELTRMVTNMDINSVLTEGRAELVPEITRNSQAILNELETGVLIVGIELTEIIPPVETISYFEAVRSAAVNKETRIQQAREAASTLILSAQADAGSYTHIALLNQNIRLAEVHSEMAEFHGILDQYVRSPEIIIAGNFRRRIGAIIAQSGGSIIVPEGSEAPIILVP